MYVWALVCMYMHQVSMVYAVRQSICMCMHDFIHMCTYDCVHVSTYAHVCKIRMRAESVMPFNDYQPVTSMQSRRPLAYTYIRN